MQRHSRRNRAATVIAAAALMAAASTATATASTTVVGPRPPAASDAQLTCSDWSLYGLNIVYSCYDRKHDNFWVFDARADGTSALARWKTATGEQSGLCKNSSGAGTWKRCNYDLREFKPNGTRNTVRWDEFRQNGDGSPQLITAPAGTSAT